MQKRFLAITVACVALTATAAFAQGGLKTTPVRGTIYVIEGGGGNVGVCVGDDGMLVVDDKVSQMSKQIVAELAKLKPGKPRYLLNTHFHGDHTGNNVLFGHDATIIAQDNVRKRLMVPQQRNGRTVDPLDPAGWPVITFKDEVSIHFNGEDIDMFYAPAGHTDGDCMVYFKGSNVLHMGDQFFVGRFPYIDPESGGTVTGYIANTKKVLDTFGKDVILIAGHGGPTGTMDDLRDSYAMLVATRDIVYKRVDDGMSLEDAKAAGLPEEFARWNGNFISTEKWIETLYLSRQ